MTTMISALSHDPHVWAIVLAGGEGERMKPFITRWLGRHCPKQYCAFVGSRSMFQHTVDRALRLVPPERIVAVVSRDHRDLVTGQLLERGPARVVYQPANRDTAPGIFLPLTYVAALDPEATVVVLPSDHFAYPEDRLVAAIRDATSAAMGSPGHLVLVGASPDRLELDYGWILREGRAIQLNGIPVYPVRSFLEKPERAKAEAAWEAGALWNTLVFAARAETLWTLGWRFLPSLMPLFERLKEVVGTEAESHVLRSIYEAMPQKNISYDLLQCMTEHLSVIELNDVLWSDWGRPERVAEALRQIGRSPAFPEDSIEPKASAMCP